MIIQALMGSRLREERKRLGFSQEEFASRAGVSRGTQKGYERESTAPDIRYLVTIEQMGVDLDYVLTARRGPDDLAALDRDESLLVDSYRAVGEGDQAALLRIAKALLAVKEAEEKDA